MPTNDRAIDEGGEFLGTIPKIVAHRGEGENDVQVPPDKLYKKFPAVLAIGDKALRLHLASHFVDLINNGLIKVGVRSFIFIQYKVSTSSMASIPLTMVSTSSTAKRSGMFPEANRSLI